MTAPGPDAPPPTSLPLLRLARWATRPVERFLRVEAASGILLLIAAAVALAWANSRWADDYVSLWHTPLGVRIGDWTFERTLEWFVNDVLMVVFFFVVGAEIKRELVQGDLSTWRRAALPAIAALGGMAAPAAIYLLVAGGDPASRPGWGVPTATDIAFAVGVLMLLGKRVPAALRVLLLALAVIDDLGAIIVIALFYSSGVEIAGLAVAAGGLGGIFLLRALGAVRPGVYVLPAAIAWAGTYAANVHPTIAGVAVGLLTPVLIHDSGEPLASSLATREPLRTVPLIGNLTHALHPWVAYVIMPIFALANAGVALDGVDLSGGASQTVAIAVALGLVLGKPIGVFLACTLVLKLGIAQLPVGLSSRHLLVLGTVAGVGFTMALFVAQLAFADPGLLGAAKLGILGASVGAIVLGLSVGRLLLPAQVDPRAAATADEAEASEEL